MLPVQNNTKIYLRMQYSYYKSIPRFYINTPLYNNSPEKSKISQCFKRTQKLQTLRLPGIDPGPRSKINYKFLQPNMPALG